ncbi:hypothetical protein GCE9029_02860 [Grimontia celer]|uniref:Uncharacterized protein n=1 Tax=Grimontia celer TaxID=1796497 RepID=A0A128F4Y9_9GAMM|nr:hypothetical protein [Grimontia celer]CZF81839.1 hypothetical protein GCE9029_02860 [Grimontia celer]
MAISRFLTKMHDSLTGTLNNMVEFRERMWIVNVREAEKSSESFVISEDNFREPMEWMIDQNYSSEMLERLESLKLSESIRFTVGGAEHCLFRVK